MALRDWLQPPRRLIALFLLVTLVPSLALVALGWRLLEQDRALSLSQLSERRDQAADLAVSGLEQVVAAAEQTLRDPQALRSVAASDNDVVAVIFGTERVEAFPRGRLTFYPSTEAGTEAPTQRFAEGEDFEFRQHALAGRCRCIAVWLDRQFLHFARARSSAWRGPYERRERTGKRWTCMRKSDSCRAQLWEVCQPTSSLGGLDAKCWSRCSGTTTFGTKHARCKRILSKAGGISTASRTICTVEKSDAGSGRIRS